MIHREISKDAEPTQTITIRRYQPQDKEPILGIIEQVWGPCVGVHHAFLWDWKHSTDVTSQNDHNMPLVAERNGRIVGYSGGMSVQYKIGETISEGMFSVDVCVDRNARGTGFRLLWIRKSEWGSVAVTHILSKMEKNA